MAQTKIWPVKSHLPRAIRYILNPAKTLEGKLVSGVNLFIPPNDWQTPANQMVSTKLRFGKQGGRLAYHLEQSFKPGEVTPKLVHQIGVGLAKELFRDKYESYRIKREGAHPAISPQRYQLFRLYKFSRGRYLAAHFREKSKPPIPAAKSPAGLWGVEEPG